MITVERVRILHLHNEECKCFGCIHSECIESVAFEGIFYYRCGPRSRRSQQAIYSVVINGSVSGIESIYEKELQYCKECVSIGSDFNQYQLF